MSLTYVDARDVVARSQYIEDAPTTLQGEPLDTPQAPIFVMPETQPAQEINHPQRPPRERRAYRRVTNAQRLELVNLFRQHGDDRPAEWYSHEVGIRLARTRDLHSLLRNGKSVMPKGHYRRRSRVEPFQRLIARCLNKNPTISINGVRECLQRLVDDCAATTDDEVQAIDPILVDAIVERRGGDAVHENEEQAPHVPVDDDAHFVDAEASVDFVDELDRSEMDAASAAGASQGNGVVTTVRVPSKSAILAFVKGESGDALRREIAMFSFKRETVRGVNANSDENKEARVRAIEVLNGKIRGGYRWVCLDESSWRVAATSVYGWSKRGERCFITKAKSGLRLTSIATIDATGMGDCFLVCGSSDAAVFEASLKRVMKAYDDIGVRAVFWCDNCSIHGGIERLVAGSRH